MKNYWFPQELYQLSKFLFSLRHFAAIKEAFQHFSSENILSLEGAEMEAAVALAIYLNKQTAAAYSANI